jgi:hypothetical protein
VEDSSHVNSAVFRRWFSVFTRWFSVFSRWFSALRSLTILAVRWPCRTSWVSAEQLDSTFWVDEASSRKVVTSNNRKARWTGCSVHMLTAPSAMLNTCMLTHIYTVCDVMEVSGKVLTMEISAVIVYYSVCTLVHGPVTSNTLPNSITIELNYFTVGDLTACNTHTHTYTREKHTHTRTCTHTHTHTHTHITVCVVCTIEVTYCVRIQHHL